VSKDPEAHPKISTTAWQQWKNRYTERMDCTFCPFWFRHCFEFHIGLLDIFMYTVSASISTRPLHASALSSLCQSAHHLCYPARCHSPSPLALYLFCSPALCVERLESTARVRVGRLRGSPRSHLLSHLVTIGIGRSSRRGPGQELQSGSPQ